MPFSTGEKIGIGVAVVIGGYFGLKELTAKKGNTPNGGIAGGPSDPTAQKVNAAGGFLSQGVAGVVSLFNTVTGGIAKSRSGGPGDSNGGQSPPIPDNPDGTGSGGGSYSDTGVPDDSSTGTVDPLSGDGSDNLPDDGVNGVYQGTVGAPESDYGSFDGGDL